MTREPLSAPKIVVGVDGSAQSREAVAWAVDHVRGTPGKVRLVNVWRVPAEVSYPPEHDPAVMMATATSSVEVAMSEEQNAAMDAVARQVEANKARHERSSLRLLERTRNAALGDPRDRKKVELISIEGHPGAALVRQSEDADLLVVGSHRATRAAVTMLGSVSLYCSLHASCPVVILPRRKRASKRRQPRQLANKTG